MSTNKKNPIDLKAIQEKKTDFHLKIKLKKIIKIDRWPRRSDVRLVLLKNDALKANK